MTTAVCTWENTAAAGKTSYRWAPSKKATVLSQVLLFFVARLPVCEQLARGIGGGDERCHVRQHGLNVVIASSDDVLHLHWDSRA